MGSALQIIATKAENLLEKSELPKLADFYRALVDAYPGLARQLLCRIWFTFLIEPSAFDLKVSMCHWPSCSVKTCGLLVSLGFSLKDETNQVEMSMMLLSLDLALNLWSLLQKQLTQLLPGSALHQIARRAACVNYLHRNQSSILWILKVCWPCSLHKEKKRKNLDWNVNPCASKCSCSGLWKLEEEEKEGEEKGKKRQESQGGAGCCCNGIAYRDCILSGKQNGKAKIRLRK